MRVKPAIGSLPSRVFKAYKEKDEQYARAFAEKGIIRLGQLQSYQKIEDPKRKDESEGEGLLSVPGQIPSMHFNAETGELLHMSVAPGHWEYNSTFINRVYVFCLASEEVDLDYLRSKMGPHVVEVFDTPRFLESFSNALDVEPIPDHVVGFVKVFKVLYTKREISEAGDYLNDNVHISVAQKPRTPFEKECEWRIAVVMNAINADITPDINELFLNLADSASFARLLT